MTSIVDPGTHGFQPPCFRPMLKCDVAVVKGGCYIFDVIGSTSLVEGAEGHHLGHVIAVPADGTIPDAAGLYDYVCWAEEDGAVGDIIRFTVEGQLSVQVPTATVKDDVLITDEASPSMDLATGISGKNIVAKALEDEPGVDGVGFATCQLHGWNPIGSDVSTAT